MEVSSILIEETRLVNISLAETPKIMYITLSLPLDQIELLIEILQENIGQFAWSYQDMLEIDPNLVVHHLAVDLKLKPVKQKLQKMHPKVTLLVKADLEKMLEEKVIHLIKWS